jgi:hypothetical protein
MDNLKRMEKEREQRIRLLNDEGNKLVHEALRRGLSLGLALTTAFTAGGLKVTNNAGKDGKPRYGIEWMASAKADAISNIDPAIMAEAERQAQETFDYLTSTNAINFTTGKAYTYDEVLDRILMMNGLYIPASTEDAYAIPVELTNFACCPLNAPSTLLTVNYMADSDAISKDQVEAAVAAAPIPNWAKLLLVGNNYCRPYLEWLGAKVQRMYSTTDKAEFISLYNEITDSLVAIFYRDGFELNGVVYRDIDFANQSNIGAGNVLQFLGFTYQPGYVEGVKTEYDSTSVLSGPATVYIETVHQNFGGNCDANEFMGAYEHDASGQLVPRQGDNFGTRVNINTINAAQTNAMLEQLGR